MSEDIDFEESASQTFPEGTEISIAVDGILWKQKKLKMPNRFYYAFYPKR